MKINCGLEQIADCGSKIADRGSRIKNCGLRIADCGFKDKFKIPDKSEIRNPKSEIILLIILVLFMGCKKREEVKTPEAPARPPVPIEVEEPKYETYQYFDMGRKDPFVPLIGVGSAKGLRKGEVEVIIEEGTKTEESGMEKWTISGLIWDKKEKMAVIKGTDENYLFSGEALLDKDGNEISEIKAKLKGDGILLSKKGKDIFLKMEEKKIEEENIIE